MFETKQLILQVMVKVKVKQYNYRPGQALEGSRSLRFLDFNTIGT